MKKIRYILTGCIIIVSLIFSVDSRADEKSDYISLGDNYLNKAITSRWSWAEQQAQATTAIAYYLRASLVKEN